MRIEKVVGTDAHGVCVRCDDGYEYLAFPSEERAGEEARRYWLELAKSDPEEFANFVGAENVVGWALGIDSMDFWLDLCESAPEETFSSMDGKTCFPSRPDTELADELYHASGDTDWLDADDPVAYAQ